MRLIYLGISGVVYIICECELCRMTILLILTCSNRHGIAHEQFVWDLKSEPGIIDKFARIWGTDELMVSFGGLYCLSLVFFSYTF